MNNLASVLRVCRGFAGAYVVYVKLCFQIFGILQFKTRNFTLSCEKLFFKYFGQFSKVKLVKNGALKKFASVLSVFRSFVGQIFGKGKFTLET